MENAIGQRILSIIEVLNISKAEFCSKISIATTVLYNIINGRNKPSYDLLGKIINTFDVDPNYLLKGTGQMFISNDRNEINSDSDVKNEIRNVEKENVFIQKQAGEIVTPFVTGVSQPDKKNFDYKDYSDPNHEGNKRSDSTRTVRYSGDIIESNRDFFEGGLHGSYGEMKEYHWEYLQIRYYEPMSMYRLKILYSAETEGLRDIYNSRQMLVDILHYLKASDFLLEKFPIEPEFKEYLKEMQNDWKMDFKELNDGKLELILKIIHVKQGVEHQAGQLTKLIDYMYLYKDLLLTGKPLI